MLNRIVLVGRLTKDPEIRKTENDLFSVANFDLAVDNTAREKDGTRGTCFLECRVFGDKAENVAKYVRKGSKVAIDGSINQRNFVRQDGSRGHAFVILVDSIEFLDNKKEDAPSNSNNLDSIDLPDDDLPFDKEETQPQEKVEPKKKAKFDPYTGKPLKTKGNK